MAARPAASDVAARSGERDIVATRVFDAPRALVFEMWTDPRHIARWWGPNGFTNTIHEMDVRPGGAWRFVMHGPDGVDYKNEIHYVEVARPERLVYDHVSGPRFHVTVTFADEGGKTRVEVCMRFESGALRDRAAEELGAVEGLGQTLGRLAEELGRRGAVPPAELALEREFAAPPSLLFDAWTRTEHFSRWFGPHGTTIPFCRIEPQPGGVIHYCMRLPDGSDHWARGTFREVVRPERLVFAVGFVDADGRPAPHPAIPGWPLDAMFVTTVTFAGDAARTKLTLHQTVVTATAGAGDLIAGDRKMAGEGWRQTLDRLATLVA